MPPSVSRPFAGENPISRRSRFGLGTLTAMLRQARRGWSGGSAVPDSHYRSVVETMSDGVVVQSVDGTVELCNARVLELFGLTEAELVASFGDRSRWTAVRADGSPFLYDEYPVNVVLRTGEPCRDVLMGVRSRDGAALWVAVNASAIRENGRIRAVVSTYSDVTLRHEMDQIRRASDERSRLDANDRADLALQLRQAQKMEAVGQLAGGIAHDFNNLLTAISCNVELLLDEISPGDSRRDDVVQIREAADRAATLTRQLLAFSRRQVLAPKSIDLNVTVAGMERMLARVLSTDVILRTELDPSLPPAFADAGQMEQVMMNLVLNARDAMPTGGTIVVRTGSVVVRTARPHHFGILPPGRYVTLSVKDAGTGITTGALEHLFEPFFTTKPHDLGTGLGLATVHGIVSQSGGQVIVETAVGQGSEFSVHLPVYDSTLLAPPAAQSAPPPPPVPPPPASELTHPTGHTVLVVDDEPAVRDVAMRCLYFTM
jgi:PAS domain S-box-containing protein